MKSREAVTAGRVKIVGFLYLAHTAEKHLRRLASRTAAPFMRLFLMVTSEAVWIVSKTAGIQTLSLIFTELRILYGLDDLGDP